MRRYLIALCLMIVTAMATMAADQQTPFGHGRLRVNTSGRYLEHDDGTPFLYLGDTAWELLARLSYEEACHYIDNRARKGFTVIQTVILSELDDIIDPTESYLAHIDSVLTYAYQQGLYMAILPTWGDKVDRQWGKGPEIFNEKNAWEYGNMLGRRWAKRHNIIWIIGGDRSGEGRNRLVWNALARGIKSADKNHLMTYHPHGEHSSSMWFHEEDWLDFNMFQSGHCQQSYDIYRRLLLPDRALTPTKPVMDGEPRYEDIPRNFKLADGRFEAIDVRQSLYQSMLSGACGYTYGNNNIWQMYAPGRKPQCDACRYWYEALDMEGAEQLRHFITLWQEIPFTEGHPMPDCLQSTDGYTANEAVAFEAGDYFVCYFPGGLQWQLDLPDSWQQGYTLQWMDPRTGTRTTPVMGHGTKRKLVLPTSTDDSHDWVLIIKQNNE